jgi:hypothetical protein
VSARSADSGIGALGGTVAYDERLPPVRRDHARVVVPVEFVTLTGRRQL